MHQSHNIPWHLITANLEFKENDRRFTPPRTGLASKNNPNASQELKHFTRKFAQAIRSFSDTERAKYPDQKLLDEGNVFSDELKTKYPEYLNSSNQKIQYWIQCAERGSERGGFGWSGNLSEVVKILLYENELSTLIMMAHHPNIPIARLHRLSWDHDAGFCRIMETALRAYLFFNAAEATNTLANGEYTHGNEYQMLFMDEGMLSGYPHQQVPHHHFLRSCGVYDGTIPQYRDIHVHKDIGLLKEYLKTLFALLYRYDLLMRECGIEPSWELEISRNYPINKVISWEDRYPSQD